MSFAPILTPRLVLRRFTDADFEPFFAYRNDPEVARYQGWCLPYAEQTARNFIAEMKQATLGPGEHMQLAIVQAQTGALLGDVMFHVHRRDPRQATIGYTLARAYWRQGYARESLRALLTYLFGEMQIHRVVADCDVANEKSWRLLESLGFRREAHFIESFLHNGKYTSEYNYGLLAREWEKQYE
jgi:RimJ/RimL family protein N-acetyltransferase